MRLPARWATAALLLVAPLIAVPTTASADTGPEGVLVEQSTRAVPGQYIVTLEPELSPETVLREFGLSPLFRYGNVLHGFAATLTATELEAVRTVPGVLAVEENAEVAVEAPRAGSLFRAPAVEAGAPTASTSVPCRWTTPSPPRPRARASRRTSSTPGSTPRTANSAAGS